MADADPRIELLALLELKAKRKRENRLLDYHPYAKQRDFHAVGTKYRERLFAAGNQLGKCRLVHETVEHPGGTRSTMGELWSAARPFDVWAWDGWRRVATPASHVVRKAAEPCVEVLLADGSRFTAALGHQVLTDSGFSSLSQLLTFAPCLPACDWGSAPTVRVSDVPHLTGTTADYRERYFADRRHDGEPLPIGATAVRSLQTSAAGAPPHTPLWSPSGESSLPTGTHTGQPGFGPPSSLGDRVRCAVRGAASLARAAYTRARSTTRSDSSTRPLAAASASLLRSACAILLRRWLKGYRALVTPNGEGNHIVAWWAIGMHEVYDLTVPAFHNYVTDGLVHHNTMAGAAEVAMHLTGRYPADWQGIRMTAANRWLVGSESAELTRKGVQRLLFGPPEIEADWGTGFIPKECIQHVSRRAGVADAIASAVIKHVDGYQSTIQLQSYDQGRTKWQADTVDGIWFDEEPPEDLYMEGLTRTNVTQGPIMVTFTPLLGYSSVVIRFMKDKHPGTTVVQMTIDDAEHYSQEQRDAIIASYPEHEREARTLGIPAMGEGRVFPVTEAGIKVDPFPIPSHWPRIVGADFGVDHPAALAWLAWDRDTDTLYVYDLWREKSHTPAMQSLIYRPRGDWIPVAWPHDGLQRDKGSGIQLAAQYKTCGFAMLPERATFDDGSNGLEAGVQMMLERFMSRRLRVFSNLTQWFEEFRMYHRKDGLIVPLNDDALSATRYAMMMRRHAKTELEVRGRGVGNLLRPFPGHTHHAVLDPTTGY